MPGIQLNPLGGLDLDSDNLYVQNGDQTANKNTRGITKGGQSSKSKEIIVGNQFAYSLGSTQNQGKTYRVFVNASDAATAYVLNFSNQNHELLQPSPTVNDTVAGDAGNITNFLTNFVNAIDAVLVAAGESVSYVQNPYDVAANLGYVDITFSTYPGQDFYLSFSATSINPVIDPLVLNESIDNTIVGPLQVMASDDYLGKVFQFSTTQDEMPENFDIASVTNSAGLVLVTTTTACNVQTDDLVLISGTSYTTSLGNSLDGKFIATFVSSTSFTLQGTLFGTGGTNTGTVTTNSVGLGEIGVATFDENTDAWTYTRLLRSKELNWRLQRQHDRPKITYDNGKYNIYYTDFYNPPGVFYYYGAFYADGALEVYNPQTNTGDRGIYKYDFIADEVRLQQNLNTASITFSSQQTAGGVLAAGSYRYTFRLLTESLTGTPYASLTNPVPVYRSNQNGPAFNVLGSVLSEATQKINILTVSGIDTELFKYVELVSLFYTSDQSFQSYTISRTEITADTMTLSHSGNEDDTALLDPDELLTLLPVISRAKSNLILDNRYLLGNVETPVQYDFTPWTTTFTHALFKSPLNDIGDIDNYRYGEYQRPENVYQRTGYMGLEQYRFVAVPFYRNGLVGDPFYIDDIDFTTSATNVVTTANAPYGNRRTAGLADYDLTDGGATPGRQVYAFAVQFDNITPDYALPDGKTIRDVLLKIEIWRADCIPEVLFTGIVFPSLNGGGSDWLPQTAWYGSAAPPLLGTFLTPLADPDRTLGFAVVPDMLYSQTAVDFTSGDQIYLFGGPSGAIAVATAGGSIFADLDGVFTTAPTPLKTIETVVTVSGLGQTGSVTTTALGTVNYILQSAIGTNQHWEASLVIGLGAAATDYFQLAAATDAGIYYFAYYRQNTNKYGSITEGIFYPTGQGYTFTSASPATVSLQVFGGDTFTQKSWLHAVYNGPAFPNLAGAGLGYYTQNRANVQNHYNQTGPGAVWPENFGSSTMPSADTWLETVSTIRDKFGYENTYNPGNLINNTNIWDPTLIRTYHFPTRIYYSAVKPEGAVKDLFRQILNTWYDCDSIYGELMHLANVGGELITIQQGAATREYFNASGNLELSNSSQSVIVGSAGVFSRRGTKISDFGTRHKFSVVEAISVNGHPFVTWINTDHKVLMKFDPYSGARAISVPGFRSYLLNNLTWVQDYDMPAYGLGIHGVSNQRYSEVIYTIVGQATSVEWEIGISYPVGTRVHLAEQPAGTTTTFEAFREIYTAVFQALSSALNEPETVGGGEIWVKSTDNNRYSFVYGEQENKVICFVTFKPKHYLKYLDGFLSPLPCVLQNEYKQNRIYEHDKGIWAEWYKGFNEATPNLMTFTQGSTTVTTTAGFTATFPHPEAFCYVLTYLGVEYTVESVTSDTELVINNPVTGATGTAQTFYVVQSENAEVEMVLNWNPNTSKNFRAVQYVTEIVPRHVDFTTPTQVSFLDADDFESTEGYFYAAIQNDSTNTGLNDGDTSRLYGRYIKSKLTLERRVYQKLYNFVVKVMENFRNFRT